MAFEKAYKNKEELKDEIKKSFEKIFDIDLDRQSL